MPVACASIFDYWEKVSARHSCSRSDAKGRTICKDLFDGAVHTRIVSEHGGVDEIRFAIFIAQSTHGFQTFENPSYDCWPVAVLHSNVSPNLWHVVNNPLPLGFPQAPKGPGRLDTWFIPLANEIREINDCGGSNLAFYHSVKRCIKVHIVHQSGDRPSVSKQDGLMVHNAPCPC